MVRAPEYQGRFGGESNTQFVTALYEGALGRAPDPAGLDSWNAMLGSGTSRAQIAVDISESPEDNTHLASAIQNGFG